LTRLLLNHPEIDSIICASRSMAGTRITEYDPGISDTGTSHFTATDGRFISPDTVTQYAPDVVFSALPHLVSADLCADFIGKVPVFDLSADFRLRSDERFAAAYGQARPQPRLQDSAVYGLTEWYRKKLRTAQLVACPGCYPTATMLPLIPLLREDMIQGCITVNAMSGITGAGRKALTRLLYAERTENMEAYLPGSRHRHWNEISQEIEAFSHTAETPLKLLFTPHLIPAKQGMLVTTAVELKNPATEQRIHALLTEAYTDSPLVEILPVGEYPQTRSVRGTGRCRIGIQLEDSHLLLFSAIDNLYKGASSQAVQAMNIRMGFAEDLGIPTCGEV
ncbi:MAG: N-acetyl-gamma-glutamyl-phosphate reductase, partial [Spirochaeta sp.]